MRLTPEQQTTIRAIAAAHFGVQAPIWLSGSRLDANCKTRSACPLTWWCGHPIAPPSSPATPERKEL